MSYHPWACLSLWSKFLLYSTVFQTLVYTVRSLVPMPYFTFSCLFKFLGTRGRHLVPSVKVDLLIDQWLNLHWFMYVTGTQCLTWFPAYHKPLFSFLNINLCINLATPGISLPGNPLSPNQQPSFTAYVIDILTWFYHAWDHQPNMWLIFLLLELLPLSHEWGM